MRVDVKIVEKNRASKLKKGCFCEKLADHFSISRIYETERSMWS